MIDRVTAAADLIERYGSIDGAHHKQWVLDQVMRALLADGYEAWAGRRTVGPNGEEGYYPPWDTGTPP